MAQLLTSVNNGVVDVQTTTQRQGTVQLSRQYVQAKDLKSRPTEWVPGGRPIYRRLPSVSETYQVDFDADGEIGYCFVPWGEGIFGPASMEVVATDAKTGIIIKGGNIIWKYGRNPVLPTLVDFIVLDVPAGRYLVGYDLVYNDDLFEAVYVVEDYPLTGEVLTVTSSTDSILGWRYPASNALLNENGRSWKNKDTLFPSYTQPTTAHLQWVSSLGSAYSSLTLRCPPDTAFTGTATLSYVTGTTQTVVDTVSVVSDTDGQFFRFELGAPSFQTGWRVDFDDTSIAISSIIVSGQVTQLRRPSGPTPKAALAMHAQLTAPTDRVFCALAYVDVDRFHRVEGITDIRNIVHRDLSPVAEWLTAFWDEQLIDLHSTFKAFAPLWMAPTTALKYEYDKLVAKGVVLSDSVILGK